MEIPKIKIACINAFLFNSMTYICVRVCVCVCMYYLSVIPCVTRLRQNARDGFLTECPPRNYTVRMVSHVEQSFSSR
jgi:hypothetical protein